MTVKTQSLKFCQLTVVLVLHKCKSRNEMLRNVTIPENRNRTPRPRAWSCENKWRHFCYPIIIGGFGLAERAQHSTLGCKDKNDVTMLDLIWQSPTLRYRWSLVCSDKVIGSHALLDTDFFKIKYQKSMYTTMKSKFTTLVLTTWNVKLTLVSAT